MYPSIKFSLIKKAVDLFSRNFPSKARCTLNTCLKLIEFGMWSTLLSFCDKYYQYHGGDKNGERGLAISGFESAFLKDLVANYLLKETIDLFGEEHHFKGMYCDDSIYVTTGKWNAANLRNWMQSFQWRVKELAGSTHVQSTGIIWDRDYICQPNDTIDEDSMIDLGGGVTVAMNNFSVYQKMNQRLKYVPSTSTHTGATLRAIPSGVLTRLAILNAPLIDIPDRPIDEIYPDHANAL